MELKFMQDKNIASSGASDVIIVGAGPTGLMAALLLHQSGIQIRIFDKNEQQAHESRAFILQARSLELFLNLGIVDQFIEHGMITPGMQIYVNGRKAAQANLTDIGATDSPYAFVLTLPQSKIEALLIAELEKRGVTVEHNMEVMAFAQDDDGVVVTIQNQQGSDEHFHAAYLLGADGAHSVIRSGLGLTFEGSAYPQNFMLADCSIDWPLEYSYAKIFLRGNTLGVYLPLNGKTLGRVLAINPKTQKDTDASANQATTAEPLALAEIEKVFQEASGLPVKLSNSIWTTRYRIHHRGANKYSEGRVFVAGDAAHIHSPAGGQGMNTGLQDAANLAWKLALRIKNHGGKNLLATYNDERWPIGQNLLKFTDNLFGKLSRQTRFAIMLRNFFVPIVMSIVTRIPRCRYNLFRFVSELGIRYHENIFLQDNISQSGNHPPKRLRPGYRAPNASYKRNHDIFGLIQGYQFHLLVLSRQSLSKEEIDVVINDLETLPTSLGLPLNTHFISHSVSGENKNILQAETNDVFEKYGISDKYPFGLFLIRPDGYIAYRADTLNISKLKKYCELFSS
jgi:2-polyprenyl-6-methoxyphenol hydroxylase-like FAD-dependent oxidoreductase